MTLRTRMFPALGLVLALLATTAGAGARAAAPPPGGEIIGGTRADPGEYPFMVALLQRSVSDPWRAQFCGGSLIDDTVVLTAAHCVEGLPARRLDVLIGTNRLIAGRGTRIHATAIHVHPGWNPRTNGNDIAVVELAQSATQQPIPTIRLGQFDLWDPGTPATVIGWGDRDPRPQPRYDQYPIALYEVMVPLVSNAGCRADYGNLFLAKKMLCAGDRVDGGRDSCQGDSGGPLFVPDGGSGVVQVGIVSWGIGCGSARFPGVYTRLARYAGFVDQYLS
ncbi:MAG TPA: serine protease [Acidimicrobiales bacterium]|nr:serine protease [Acidimicrobiales bacterium]